MREMLGCQVGLSDHTLGTGASIAAVALGATFIERHFTLSRAEGGVDAAFSLEPAELKTLVEESARSWEALGRIQYGPTGRERASLQFRRSLYVARDMRTGEAFTPESLRAIRPGSGLPPKHYSTLLGKRVNRDVRKGTPVTWDLIG
jgi:N-acetylneuraminate synthase